MVETEIYDQNTNESGKTENIHQKNGFTFINVHKAKSEERIDISSTSTQMSVESNLYINEPVDNTGLTPSGDGYYYIGTDGGYNYCPTLFGDLYRKYTTAYEGETHNWTWGAGETIGAISAYAALFFSGPIGIITEVLIFIGGTVLAYEQSVMLETITFDYWYKVVVLGGVYHQANKNATYWKSMNTTTGTVKWAQKSINIPCLSCDSLIQTGIDKYLETHTHTRDNNCDSSCNICGSYLSVSHTYSNECDTTCNVCGNVRTVSHNYIWVITSAGHAKECTICHNQISAGSHTYTDWQNNGSSGEARGCTTCALSAAIQTRPHDYNIYWLYGQPATCTIQGIKVYDCTNCIYENQEVVPALGHSWGSWTIASSPTCTASGSQTHACTRCYTSESQTLSALGHNWVYESYEAAHPHYKYNRCTRCQATQQRTDTISWGTYWTSWYSWTSPTCTSSGSETRDLKCSLCNAWISDEYRSVAALGHNWSWVTYYSYKDSSTCPDRLYYEDEKCSRCGIWGNVDRTYLSYEGHDWSAVCYYSYREGPYMVYWYDNKCSTCGTWAWVDWSVYEYVGY